MLAVQETTHASARGLVLRLGTLHDNQVNNSTKWAQAQSTPKLNIVAHLGK